MNCCTPDYDTVFTDKRARNDLKRYRKKGPDTSTRLLVEALKAAGVERRTLLDIGGGVGVIDHELLAAGVEAAVHVEAAPGAARAAADEAARRGTLARIQFKHGDFVAISGDISSADVVTLDRVICCYPDMEQLVAQSARRARQLYGIVIPRQRRLTKIMRAGINLVFRITRNAFRFHIHSPAAIDRIVQSAGLTPASTRHTLIWSVVVYRRLAT